MQHLFARANEALCDELAQYATTLRTIVEALPQARALCVRVVAEVRLVEALLAFSDGPEVAPLRQITLHVSNLWGVREDLPVRATGFGSQIAESSRAHAEALRGLSLVGRGGDAALNTELRTCFVNILTYLERQKHMLEECEEHLRPFRGSPELTRKRLNLLIAAAEARLPDTPERKSAVETYAEAADLLGDWANGITLDERGIAVLERCLDLLGQNASFAQLAGPSDGRPEVIVD